MPMTFSSILSESAGADFTHKAPACFVDLNIDQIVAAVITGKEEYNLSEFFYTPVRSIDAIRYRHEIFQDLENGGLFERIRTFAETMHAMREQLARVDKLRHRHRTNAWFMHAIEFYCDAIRQFASDLSGAPLKSRGLVAFRQYLADYAAGAYFTSLVEQTDALKADLAHVRYEVLINGDTFTVRDYGSEADYSVIIERTFDKFKQGAVKDYRNKFRSSPDMNHIEEKILDFVALLNSDLFFRLDAYCVRHANFVDEAIGAFDREIQFYISYLQHIGALKHTGLYFCYPHISPNSKDVYVNVGFDLALAHKLIGANSTVVCNDFFLKGRERIIVVTGPNQGGKTTFARAFGQLHYLASIGCPVPGRDAQLYLFDEIFTHFEKEEKVENLRGKLEDDLVRIRSILKRATSRSIVIMNEIFTSTTVQDEVFLSRKVMETIIQLDALCVWVTFVDELAWLSGQTVSMVSTINPKNAALRTFKVLRRPADGLAYAMAIAEKYRLTHEQIRERVAS
jgi:hypothetical protein